MREREREREKHRSSTEVRSIFQESSQDDGRGGTRNAMTVDLYSEAFAFITQHQFFNP